MKGVGTTTIFTAQYSGYVIAQVRDLYSQNENANFNFQLPAIFFLYKSYLIKSCSSFDDLLAYEMSWPYVDW
jgi:hypothetical protein